MFRRDLKRMSFPFLDETLIGLPASEPLGASQAGGQSRLDFKIVTRLLSVCQPEMRPANTCLSGLAHPCSAIPQASVELKSVP
jgi:hypothetical protein